MELRPLGDTGLEVSAVSFGTAPLGGLFGAVDDAAVAGLIDQALDAGINLVDTSPYYGDAEERLGPLIAGRRDRMILGTKAGRYGVDDFDFSPARIRSSLERSLRLLGTDHVDVFQLHDIEFVPLEPVFEDSYSELVALRDEGKCRFIGMTGYPIATFVRAMETVDLDVVLCWAHGTLLDDSLSRELLPVAQRRGVGVMNAAAVTLGLLTERGVADPAGHPATETIQRAAAAMVTVCREAGVDPAFLANQYAIQRGGGATTVIGTAKPAHLTAAIEAATAPIDEDLLAAVLALRPPVEQRSWPGGLAEGP